MTFEELDKTLDAFGGHAPFLLSLNDGEDNELTLRIAPSLIGEQREISESDEPNAALRRLLTESRPLLPDETRVYEITFGDYIIYQVGNESYCSGDPNDRFSGRFLRICEDSALLRRLGEFSDAQTLADGTYYPGKWAHYSIVTQNHIIDVISAHAPAVNIRATPHKDCALFAQSDFSSDCTKSTNKAGVYEEILGKNDGKDASKQRTKREARSLCGVALKSVLDETGNNVL